MSRRRALHSLNLGTGASMRDIKSSYRKLAKLYHPDKCGRDGSMSIKECETHFIKVQESYEYLLGKNKRKQVQVQNLNQVLRIFYFEGTFSNVINLLSLFCIYILVYVFL